MSPLARISQASKALDDYGTLHRFGPRVISIAYRLPPVALTAWSRSRCQTFMSVGAISELAGVSAKSRSQQSPSGDRSAAPGRAAAHAPRAATSPPAEECDDFAPSHVLPSSRGSHSTTLLKKPCCCTGMVRPSSLAVCTLITNSNLLDCMTGRSAGLAPLRMRPT